MIKKHYYTKAKAN